jgi:general secretion pathway protein N
MTRFSVRRLGIPTLRRKAPTLPSMLAVSRWADSTHAEIEWGRARASSLRWSVAGAVTGALISAIVFAPAAWLASAVSGATRQQFMLVEARGTVWSGSAVAVLTGGEGSRDASALPGRLAWSLRPRGLALEVVLSQPCCLSGSVAILLRPGIGRWTAEVRPTSAPMGQWPGSWLSGLGTPWNTLQIGGTLRLLSSGLTLESAQGRWHMTGGADIELMGASSRLSTLDTLGSYRLSLQGQPPSPGAKSEAGDVVKITLTTVEGALQVNGTGTWGPGGLHFLGEAASRDADESALTNLLNLIGRREGARSVISIG